MTTSSEVFLGIIAFASLAIALVQIGLIVVVVMLARRIGRLADQVEQEMKPLFARANEIGGDVSRVTSLLAAQVERVDRLGADFVKRIEQALGVVQHGVSGSAREARALLSGLRASLEALRHARPGGRRSRADDEDALFV